MSPIYKDGKLIAIEASAEITRKDWDKLKAIRPTAHKDSDSIAPTGLVSISTTKDRTGLPQVRVGLNLFTQETARKVAYEMLALFDKGIVR